MANRLTTFGNDLYTGKRSFNFVGGRKIWYAIARRADHPRGAHPGRSRGVNFSIEFRGGSQFQIAGIENAEPQPAIDAVASVVPDADAHVTIVGGNAACACRPTSSSRPTRRAVATALAEAYDVAESEVTSSFIGPTLGCGRHAAGARRPRARSSLLAGVIMALYFRTWKMSLAAILALIDDLVVTVGVYAAIGFEITPGGDHRHS